MKPYSLKISLESQYPSEICIRGRTTYWFTYTVQKVVFYLHGFNHEGFPIYAGTQKKMTRVSGGKCDITDETDERNFNTIYLTHDKGYSRDFHKCICNILRIGITFFCGRFLYL